MIDLVLKHVRHQFCGDAEGASSDDNDGHPCCRKDQWETPPPRFSERLMEIAVSSDPLRRCRDVGPLAQPLAATLPRALPRPVNLADIGLFVMVAPELNHLAQQAASAYATYLNSPRQGQAHFVNLTLERVIEVYVALKMGRTRGCFIGATPTGGC